MNRALPSRDRGHRGGNPGGQPRPRGTVPGARGLVGGVRDTAERETPPGGCPAAQEKREGQSGFDGVGALAVLSLGRCDGQPHFLSNRPGQEPSDRMRLPASCFHQFLGGDPARSLEQFEHRGGLAAVPCASGFLRAFGRFLGRAGLLGGLTLLRRDVGAPWRDTGLFVGFRVLAAHWRLRGGGFYGQFSHFDFSFGGDYRHDMNHSGARGKQANSPDQGDGMAMVATVGGQMTSGVLR